jgi:hypothetical protein
VEARWAAHDVTSTVAVSFDYSSLVVLELLARRLDRRAAGDPEGTRISGILLAGLIRGLPQPRAAGRP